MEAIVLAAGKGTRMKSERPKVLHEIFERPLLDYVLATLADIGVKRPNVVVGYGAEEVCSFLRKWKTDSRLGVRATAVWQQDQKGTGHAVACCEKSLAGFKGDLLVIPGDVPLVKGQTLIDLIRVHRTSDLTASVLSSLRVDPTGYGRILRAGGRFYAIREEMDASNSERGVQEVNTGVYVFKAPSLFQALRKIRPVNQKKEYYLTDTIEVLIKNGRRVEAFPFASGIEGMGINSRRDLSEVIDAMKTREIQYHEQHGVTFVASDQTFVAPGVQIGRDTIIYPWTYIESGVKIGRHCKIGPFAKIRKGTVIGDAAEIGSFVEVTRSRLGEKVVAKHLAYLGDAVVGTGTNVGAGTITANFDGKRKHQTRIGKKVLIGSNTVFVAPVAVGDGAQTGAGCVVTGGSKIKKGEVVVGVPARPLKNSVAKKRRK
ncbi:MAG: NTP transferase domain-containing protein [Candidatus Omnitrophica bacterium]|nr:NTP transferase domain-containing protein [Candidatus Omnitrophota bacterium]